MATTPLGIRYPVSADVPNIAQYFQNLASDVDALIDPSAWTTLTSSGAGWAAGTPAPQYSKDVSGRVWLRGVFINLSAFTPAGDVMAGLLPAGFRPQSEVIFPVFTTGTLTSFVRVTTTGRIEAYRTHGNVQMGANAGWYLDPVNFSTTA